MKISDDVACADGAVAMDTDAKPVTAAEEGDAVAAKDDASAEGAGGEGEAKKPAEPEPSSYQIENPARVVPAQVPVGHKLLI